MNNSKYWNIYNCLSIANLFRDVDFYLPTFADFRGRVYTLSNYLSYQGSDISRGLLLFSQDSNKKLNKYGLEYLLVYFANLSGLSKESSNFRIDWAIENLPTFADFRGRVYFK